MFEWDENKSLRNHSKHGLSFCDAETVFAGPCLTSEDDRFEYEERRFIALGQLAGRVVAIAYTLRGDTTRIISMRKASRRERRRYEERLETT